MLLVAVLFCAGPAFAVEDNLDAPPVQDQGGAFERIIAAIVEIPIRITKAIGTAMGLEPLDKLIFLEGLTEDEKRIAPWSQTELKFIQLWYLALSGIVMPFFLVVIGVTGLKLVSSGVNPGMRAEAISSIWRWLGALAIIILAPMLVQSLLWATAIFLEGIKFGFNQVIGAAGVGRSINDWGGVGFADINIATGSVLGTAIVKVMFLFIYIYFNILYLIRKLVVSVMLCFTPVMALLWALNKNVNAAGIWLGEIASNAFMPVAHALVLCLILGFCDVSNISDGTWFIILVFMYALIPLSEVLRNSLQGLITRMSGMNEEGSARGVMLAATGLGSLVSLSRVGKATFGGQGFNSGNVNFTGGPGRGLEPMAVRNPSPGGQPNAAAPGGAATEFYAGPAAPSRQIGFGSPPSGQPKTSWSEGPSGGTAPAFSAGPSAARQISFSSSRATMSGFGGQPASGPSRWPGYALRAASLTGAAMGGMMGTVAGAIPGGRQVAQTVGGVTAGGLRAVTMAGSLVGQAIHRRTTGQSTDFGQAVKDVTGVHEEGPRGMARAVGRIGYAGLQAARDEEAGLKQAELYQTPQAEHSLRPQRRPIGFNPRRGLV